MMDLHIHENLFSIHTERFMNTDVYPSYCIRLKLTVDSELKAFLDSKPYHRFSNVWLNIAFNRPLMSDVRTTIGISLDGPAWHEEDPSNIKREDFLEKACLDELVYQFESEEQQLSMEEEIVAAIYSHYKRPIHRFTEAQNQKEKEEFVLTYRF